MALLISLKPYEWIEVDGMKIAMVRRGNGNIQLAVHDPQKRYVHRHVAPPPGYTEAEDHKMRSDNLRRSSSEVERSE